MLKVLLVSVAAVFVVGAAQANTLYRCNLPGKKNSHTVPDEIAIEYDGAKKTVLVFDAFINNYFGEPIAAEILADNAKRLTVGWDFKNIEGRRGSTIPNVRMKATVLRASNEIHVTTSYGYGDSESGFGTCTVK